jgi:biotin operon repressor
MTIKLVSKGINANERKAWLNPKCKELKMPFSLNDVKPGMFNKAVMKRLQSAKQHGTYIPVRNGRGYSIGIQVINQDDAKKQKDNLTQLKRKHTLMMKEPLIQEWRNLNARLLSLTSDAKYLCG